MTRDELKAINDRLDAEDDEEVVEAARAKLPPEELARIDAGEYDDLDLDDADLVDDDGIDPEDKMVDKLDSKDPRVIAMIERHEASLARVTQPPAAPKPALGMGKDGVFRMTDSQARSADFCLRTQKERAKAASVETVPE
jgi:hypothetical protein